MDAPVMQTSGERFARCNGLELCYETFGAPDASPMLLVMGLAAQMIVWADEFCQLLADRGHWVIRFDNRDIGRSTILNDAPVPTRRQLILRDRGAAAYSLDDMADDTAALLDALELRNVHVVGASMGGMISQLLTIRHPQRVRSLVSIMSTTGNPRVGQPRPGQLAALFRRRPKNRAEYLDDFVNTWERIGSEQFPPDPARSRALGERCFERGVQAAGPARQMAAIIAAPDRTARLGQITVPTTVIHGDADPLVQPSGGKATAAAIPGAHLALIPGMGHHLPPVLWPLIVDLITATTQQADSTRRDQR
jgi:pimeloyl-ACP methyl ester carboxylesterase